MSIQRFIVDITYRITQPRLFKTLLSNPDSRYALLPRLSIFISITVSLNLVVNKFRVSALFVQKCLTDVVGYGIIFLDKLTIISLLIEWSCLIMADNFDDNFGITPEEAFEADSNLRGFIAQAAELYDALPRNHRLPPFSRPLRPSF